MFLVQCKRTEVVPISLPASTAPTRDDNLAMGNPSNARRQSIDNYLIDKGMYVVGYSASRGIANWVSWHLSHPWRGAPIKERSYFLQELLLPPGMYRVKDGDYMPIETGFQHGHLCPSADRNFTAEENRTTYYLSNIVPQAPSHNLGSWKELENYTRSLLDQQMECYVVAGTSGSGGIGNKGFASTLANGKLTVPAVLWKVIVVLPIGSNDVQRITAETRVIAVWMPNSNDVGHEKWANYRTSVDDIEAKTGFDLLSAVPIDIQRIIEASIDRVTIHSTPMVL